MPPSALEWGVGCRGGSALRVWAQAGEALVSTDGATESPRRKGRCGLCSLVSCTRKLAVAGGGAPGSGGADEKLRTCDAARPVVPASTTPVWALPSRGKNAPRLFDWLGMLAQGCTPGEQSCYLYVNARYNLY